MANSERCTIPVTRTICCKLPTRQSTYSTRQSRCLVRSVYIFLAVGFYHYALRRITRDLILFGMVYAPCGGLCTYRGDTDIAVMKLDDDGMYRRNMYWRRKYCVLRCSAGRSVSGVAVRAVTVVRVVCKHIPIRGTILY